MPPVFSNVYVMYIIPIICHASTYFQMYNLCKPYIAINVSTFYTVCVFANLYFVYTIYIIVYYNSQFANCISQFLLDRFGRYLKLFVSTVGPSSHVSLSHFGLAIFLCAKKPNNNVVVTFLLQDTRKSARSLNCIQTCHSTNSLSKRK